MAPWRVRFMLCCLFFSQHAFIYIVGRFWQAHRNSVGPGLGLMDLLSRLGRATCASECPCATAVRQLDREREREGERVRERERGREGGCQWLGIYAGIGRIGDRGICDTSCQMDDERGGI